MWFFRPTPEVIGAVEELRRGLSMIAYRSTAIMELLEFAIRVRRELAREEWALLIKLSSERRTDPAQIIAQFAREALARISAK